MSALWVLGLLNIVYQYCTYTHLSFVHLYEPWVNFGPFCHGTDTPKGIGMFGKRSRLNLHHGHSSSEMVRVFVCMSNEKVLWNTASKNTRQCKYSVVHQLKTNFFKINPTDIASCLLRWSVYKWWSTTTPALEVHTCYTTPCVQNPNTTSPHIGVHVIDVY